MSFLKVYSSSVVGDASIAPTSKASFLSSIASRLRRRMEGGKYEPEIDGLRFFAIAIVVVGHLAERFQRFFPNAIEHDNPLALFLSRPGLGVYLFFSISGFILATRAMQAKSALLTATFLRAYFRRRILRIEPPYLILLVCTWGLLEISGYAPENTRQFATEPASLTTSLLSSIFYLHDLVWGTFPRLFPPGWSLETEVQFYLAAPFLFFLYFAIDRRPVRLAFGVILLVFGALSSFYATRRLGLIFVDYSILRFFHFFWLGILLADLREEAALKIQSVSPFTLSLVGWGAFVCYLLLPNAPDAPATAYDLAGALLIRAAAILTIAVMFVCVFGSSSSFKRFCANPWSALIGGACYSIYLTHLQVIQLLTGVTAKLAPQSSLGAICLYAGFEIAAVVVVGMAFYVIVERSFMIPDWPAVVRAWARRRNA